MVLWLSCTLEKNTWHHMTNLSTNYISVFFYKYGQLKFGFEGSREWKYHITTQNKRR